MRRAHQSTSGAQTEVLDSQDRSLAPMQADTDAASWSEDAPRALRAGDSVARYVIIDLIGTGGMGQVYRAYDPKLRREIALKLLLPDARSIDPAADARFLREAQAMARLNDPNVIAVFDVDVFECGVYIAMEYVQGVNLRQWCEAQRRPWRSVLQVFAAAGAGLFHAHAAGLIHRDFKPTNVLLGDDGRVRVMDFGLVREAGSRDDSSPINNIGPPPGDDLTHRGVVMGTPAYMAPEHMAGKGADERSDQYSYCTALWEALYGAPL